MLTSKITDKELDFIESWHQPVTLAECLFHDFDNLGRFASEQFGTVRPYQIPMLSSESCYDFDAMKKYHNLTEQETFELKKNAGELFNLGGRLYGKCEYIENYCSLADGSRIKFKDLIDKRVEVFSLNEKTLKLENSDAYIYDNGIRDCYKLRTNAGKEITITENHPFLTDKGWKQINKIHKGDFIATPSKLPTKYGQKIDVNIAKLLGYLLGDGSTSQASIGLTNINQELISEFYELSDYFNCNIRRQGITYYFKNKNIQYRKTKSYFNRKNNIQKLVLKYKINKLAKYKEIPEEVFQWSKKEVATFLNRLFACDSHVNLHNYTIELTLASRKMIYQISNLLLRFGIHVSIYEKRIKKNKKLFTAWRLIISQDFDKFLDTIGIKSKDKGIRKNKQYNTGNLIPKRFVENIYNSLPNKKELSLRTLKKYNPSRAKCQSISVITKNKDLSCIANADIYWDKVKEIIYMGKLPTVAVSVPKNNNYISNEIISHNTMITLKLDISLSALLQKGLKAVFYSVSDQKIHGVLDAVERAMKYHPIFRMFNFICKGKPEVSFYGKENDWEVKSVNMALKGKSPGDQFYQHHVQKMWGEEVSFETEEVSNKRQDSEDEIGCIYRLAGMTNFVRHSPIGKIFYNPENEKKVLNYPRYVNPYWNEKQRENAVKKYGDEENPNFKIFVEGEIIEDGKSVFDIERVKKCYQSRKEIKRFVLKKENFKDFTKLIVVERPKNADRIFIACDVGDGAGGSDIVIASEVDGKYYYLYNIVLYNFTLKEQETLLKWLINETQANVVALDCGDALGRAIADDLEETYNKENIVRYAGNTKVTTGFERDENNKIILKKGQPIIKEEKMKEWSVRRLMALLYERRMKIPTDHKFDNQINQVIETRSGTNIIYACISETGDHLFDAFRILAIAIWLKADFSKTPQLRGDWGTGACSWT